MNILNTDLNLLKVFRALYEHKNQSIAAKQINMSQPAMSHALKRLKATFNDELFLRVDGGYVPTHQADQLAQPIIDALASLEKTLSQEIPVKMEESTKIFRVAVSDYSATTVVPKLSFELTKSAPKARLIFVQLEYDQLAFQLRTGKIDAAIAAKTSGDLAILEESLLSERVVAVARNGHPNLKDLSTLSGFLAEQHVVVNLFGNYHTWLDDQLKQIGKRRFVSQVVPFFGSIPPIVMNSNLIGGMPKRLAEKAMEQLPITVVPVPFDMPEIKFLLCTAKLKKRDFETTWLRGKILEVGHTLH
jgi:DNA-binding transcriptional LysR family regulator